MKKNNSRLLFCFIIVVGLVLYFSFFGNKKIIEPAKIINTIENYNYNLYDNSTKGYKEIFNKLSEELSKKSVDEKKYVELISQLFIIDFYTLDNKLTNLNIGGVEFVHSDVVDNFKQKANATIYKYIQSNIYGDRKQKLPVVKKVQINKVEQKVFNSNIETDNDAFYVHVSWTYEKDLDYEKSKNLIFVHEGNKLSLVEMS